MCQESCVVVNPREVNADSVKSKWPLGEYCSDSAGRPPRPVNQAIWS